MSPRKLDAYIPILLISMGLVFVVLALVIALQSFYGYKPMGISGSSVEEGIIGLVNTLVDIAVRLGFLGLIVWGGSILIGHGIRALRSEKPESSS